MGKVTLKTSLPPYDNKHNWIKQWVALTDKIIFDQIGPTIYV